MPYFDPWDNYTGKHREECRQAKRIRTTRGRDPLTHAQIHTTWVGGHTTSFSQLLGSGFNSYIHVYELGHTTHCRLPVSAWFSLPQLHTNWVGYPHTINCIPGATSHSNTKQHENKRINRYTHRWKVYVGGSKSEAMFPSMKCIWYWAVASSHRWLNELLNSHISQGLTFFCSP